VRLMMLTGARRSEINGLPRSEIEDIVDNGSVYRCWRLPATRSKNKKEIVRPLSRAALDLIDNVPVIGDGDGNLVFSLNGRTPMSMRFTDKESKLDDVSGTSDWTFHDTRRTYRTLSSRVRVPFDICERLLGHKVPTLVAAYDRHSHLAAMQEAVDKIAAEIARIIEDRRDAKIIPLR
jgi:integrase